MSSFAAIICDWSKSDNEIVSANFRQLLGKSPYDILKGRLEKAGIKKTLILTSGSLGHYHGIDTDRTENQPSARTFTNFLPISLLLTALRYRYLILLDLIYPFIDPETLTVLMNRMVKGNLWLLESSPQNAFVPKAIISRKALFHGFLHKLMKPTTNWFAAIRPASTAKQEKMNIGQSELSDCFSLETVHPHVIDILGGLDFSFEDLSVLEQSRPDFKKEVFELSQTRLFDEMQQSSTPHLANLKLLHFESRNGLSTVKSYPYDLALNITTLCNAHCEFCNYRPIKPHEADYFTLADIRRMAFLKYVSKLGLGGGIGDPLMNREFRDIFHYLKTTYPHLILRVITNGIGMNNDICNEFAGNLARLRISLNAATKKTWERLMRSKGFDQVCRQIAFLSDLKKKQKLTDPEIILLMVVSQDNIHETVKYVELARELGAQAVNFSHFMPYAMPNCNMPHKASLYFQPDKFDEWMARAEEKAAELNIRIFDRPPDFKCRDTFIFEGIRELKSPAKCYKPWYEGFLVHGRKHQKRQLQFCCIGVDTGISYGNIDLDEEYFARLRNHELLKHIRQTVNNSRKDPVCLACRSIDTADPNYDDTKMGSWIIS